MTSANQRLPRVSAAIVLASALCMPAVAAPGVSGEAFVRLPPGASGQAGQGEEIEVHSISWGTSAGGGYGEWIADVERPAGASPPRAPPTVTLKRGKAGSTAGRGVDIGSIDGEIVSPGATTAGAKASSDMVIKGSKISQNSTAGDPDRPIIAGTVPSPYNPKEYSLSKDVPTPLAKGSVWIRVSSPWAACRQGARYPRIELGDGRTTYVLRDVTVTGCGRSVAAAQRAAQEVGFSYDRLEIR